MSMKYRIIEYTRSIKRPFTNILTGIKNFWFYRKVIYRDRWWDHGFMMDIIERKLQNLDQNWSKGNAYFKEDTHREIKKVLDILDELNYRESGESDKTLKGYTYPDLDAQDDLDRVTELYEEFGELLFMRRDFDAKKIVQVGGVDLVKVVGQYKDTLIQRLWD